MERVYADNLASIYCGDCRSLPLEDESVHLVVTSPPYDNLRTYNGYSWDFEATARELWRVLVPGGVVCWNVNDSVVDGSETLTSCKQKIYFREQIGFLIHDTMIWHKLNHSHPSFNRYHQVFEYVFILSKGKPRVFNPIKDKRNAQAGVVGALGQNTYMKRDGARSTRHTYVTQEYGMRGNVWRGKTAGQEFVCKKIKHPAVMPLWLAKDLILSFSNEGDLVLDPMCGMGTTVYAAKMLGRRAIGIDISEEYCELAVRSRLHGQYTLDGAANEPAREGEL